MYGSCLYLEERKLLLKKWEFFSALIIQGFWRLCSWEWTAEELADFMNACIEGVDTMELEISVEDILNKRKIESATCSGSLMRLKWWQIE